MEYYRNYYTQRGIDMNAILDSIGGCGKESKYTDSCASCMTKQNEEKNDSTSTSSRPVSKKKKKKKRKEDAEKSKQINDKYFKWKASKN